MRKFLTILAGVLLLTLGCTREEEMSRTQEDIHSLSFTITPFLDGDSSTKTSFGSDGQFYWAERDTVGIYPNTGGQVYFALTAGAGASSAQFDGGGWDFKAGSTYYSYYPFIGDIYLDRNNISVSYLGQKQSGTNQVDHVGPFDFMYTDATHAESGMVSFAYHHLNCIIDFIVKLPAGTYSELAITAPSPVFTIEGYYDLMAESPSIISTKMSDSIAMDLENITLTSETNFHVYMMMAPVNLNGVTVTVSVANGFNTELQCKKTPSREYVRGNRYGLTCNSWTEAPRVFHTLTRADFEDENFAEYVFKKFDTNHDGMLSTAERNAVERIDVETNVIASLQGVEYFPNLLYLQCYGNNIWNSETQVYDKGLLTSLNLSNNLKLRELYCYGNQLTALDLSQNTSLTSLDCSDNLLTSVDVSSLSALEYFYCSSNPLGSLDVSANTALRTLNCDSIGLTKLNVSTLSKLEDLRCSYNTLTSLDLSNNTRLRYLYCYNNQLESLDVTQCAMLYRLRCQNNQLATLDVSGNPSLNELNAQNNPLTTLYITAGQTISNKYLPEGVTEVVKAAQGIAIDEATFPDANFRAYVSENFDLNKDGLLTNAELLSVSNIYINTDNIASLEGIQYFKNVVRLQCGGSSYNWDTGISSGLLTSIDVSQLSSLERLYLQSNRLTALDVSHNSELWDLRCDCNQLTSLDVSSNPKLTNLSCQNNQISSLDVTNNSLLQSLSCNNNQILSLDVSQNKQLYSLYCSGNQISSLDVTTNSQLQYLSCSNNQISSLDVSNNSELISLECGSNNRISTLDVSHNSKLESISCYNTQIQSLDLSALTQLTYVYAESCSALETVRLPETLQRISGYAFNYCRVLKEINMPLSLTRIENGAFQNCRALTQVTIPAGVTYIGSYAFNCCYGLTRIAVLPLTPPEGSEGMFQSTNECPIGIQISALPAYQSAAYWCDYANRFATFSSGDNEGVGYNEW